MEVKVGQRWKHVRSGVERTVFVIVSYEERVGLPPTAFDKAYGVTEIAVMTPNPCDRRDSADMKLVGRRPFAPSDWVLLPDAPPLGPS